MRVNQERQIKHMLRLSGQEKRGSLGPDPFRHIFDLDDPALALEARKAFAAERAGVFGLD